MSVTPVFDVHPDLRCEVGPLWCWYTTPAGSVAQLGEATVLTKPMMEWLVGPSYEALLQRFPEGKELTFLLDLRPMISREPAVRSLIMEAANKYLFRFSKVGIIPPTKPPSLYMTTLRAAVALASGFGAEIQLYDTLDQALESLQLHPVGAI